MAAEVERVAELICGAQRLVVFTGAGVSTESGIPDFRSPGGIWDRFNPDEFTYQHFVGSVEGRRKYWELGRHVYPVIRNAEPNAAHYAIADLHRLGCLDCVITQNIDNLHQRAGVPSEKVIELHGNATRARCLSCGCAYTRDEVHEWLERGVEIPMCDPPCGGIIKPHTILFGEAMPEQETLEAERRARRSDVFVVVGSSLVVYPAAMMPLYAKEAGAALVIINLSETPHDPYADVLLPGKAGSVMEQILERVRQRLA
ncbi:MAG: Sir2 family NAD-dependent protein deacetylase [Candidatus Rokubacteria bacterium]|nr:Sir2 family NAD-dependent protein deacetylase [Candidatus Rokubacteria bacterium]